MYIFGEERREYRIAVYIHKVIYVSLIELMIGVTHSLSESCMRSVIHMQHVEINPKMKKKKTCESASTVLNIPYPNSCRTRSDIVINIHNISLEVRLRVSACYASKKKKT